MPERYTYVTPPHMGDDPNTEYAKKIIKLGKKITDVAAHKLFGLTTTDAEYWGLAEIVTEPMADVALKMKVRHHYTWAEMCKLCPEEAKDQDAFHALVEEMLYIGLLEFDEGDHYDHNGRTAPIGERRYCLAMFVPGSAEMFNMEETYRTVDRKNHRLDEHPALASFFERMTFQPLDGITALVPPGGSGVGMHVIPVEDAINACSESVDLEHLSYWLKKYKDKIGVGQCSCRASRAALDEGCADDQWSWCIGVGDFADYCRETGKGHDITYEEAMEILEKGTKNGFVHQVTNIDGENKIFGICNCNVNICNALRTSQLFNTPNMSASAYRAKVDKEKCVACGKCVEVCPAGAVKLGQKLCKKDGSEVVYPKHELPDHMPWGRDKYDENYRDNNRINCYETGTAPCKTACPAHVAVQGYVKMAKEGRYRDALALIKKDNPFPAICGRICNKRCEAACTRGDIDAPVSIDAIKKFVAELDLKAETRYVPEVVVAASDLDHWDQKIAIIGGGPAGLSCAYYLATKGYKPTVFEKHNRLGGMLTFGIPTFKLDKDVIEAEIDVLRELGVEFKTGCEVGKDVTIAQLKEQGYQAFYIAIGCQGGRYPNVPGDHAPQCDIAVHFLHEAFDNQSQTLEGETVVVGGGNVAIDCARNAARFHSSKVSMFCLESRETMPASKAEIAEAEEENIEINPGWGPKEVLLDEKGNVRGVVFKKCVSTIDPETGRFNPQYDESVTMEVAAKHVVFAIGQAIEWGNLLEGSGVTFWHGNYPIADKLTFQTADPDIFVGGDVFTGPKFAIDAIEAGKCAAESLHRHVHPHASLTIGRNRRDFVMLDKDDINPVGYDTAGRQEAGIDEEVKHNEPFKDPNKTLTEEQVKIEAGRCLSCGASIVDENKCIGCGLCTTRCEFDAIHLYRTNPEATHMVKAEDKFKYILPYAIKRGMKITFGKKTPEEKESIKKHKAYKKSEKAAKKTAKKEAKKEAK